MKSYENKELNIEEIKKQLTTKLLGREIYCYDSLPSTNLLCKEHIDSEGTLIIAEEQSLGRGRLGRCWQSPKYKGLWFSFIIKPKLPINRMPLISHIAAAAVLKALLDLGYTGVQCKWPNDIILNSKKLGGILTELVTEDNTPKAVIVGIGLNIYHQKEDFLQELREKATSLAIEGSLQIKREKLLWKILNSFEIYYEELLQEGNIKSSIEICRSHSCIIGREVYIISKNKKEKVNVLDLYSDGSLIIINSRGEKEYLSSGEISIRGLDSYI